MTPEETTAGATAKRSARRKTAGRIALGAYLVLLFALAFLLLLLSYLAKQRRTDQDLIEQGLQKNASAMQITRSLQDQVKSMRVEVAEAQQARDELAASVEALETSNLDLAEQIDDLTKTTQALDWLWRIQREYAQKQHGMARELIEQFEASGLVEWLPAEPMIDPEYRSPLEQYQALCDALF